MSKTYIAPNATVLGDVRLGENVNIWYGAVVRGDSGAIVIGAGSNIQDNCVVHGSKSMNDTIVSVGRGCTVGHAAILHGCTVGDFCLIGMGAIVLDGARLGDYCMVGAGAVVTGKTDAPAGSLLLGNPAKIVRALTDAEKQNMEKNAAHYIELAREQFG
ncbi:MAG: gamma carbonic anhydrase family protein [Oscillospiraceae bacterium]|nr:gamma carbonic anhydrase family protein [Oscillospiraceae bacterium]